MIASIYVAPGHPSCQLLVDKLDYTGKSKPKQILEHEAWNGTLNMPTVEHY